MKSDRVIREKKQEFQYVKRNKRARAREREKEREKDFPIALIDRK